MRTTRTSILRHGPCASAAVRLIAPGAQLVHVDGASTAVSGIGAAGVRTTLDGAREVDPGDDDAIAVECQHCRNGIYLIATAALRAAQARAVSERRSVVFGPPIAGRGYVEVAAVRTSRAELAAAVARR